MKLFLIFFLSFALVCGIAAQSPRVGSSQLDPARDGSLMKSDDRDYKDAMEFACWLNENGIKFLSLHRSKLNGMFPGLTKAAFLRTEKGVVQVIFFPKPEGAENVIVTEQQRDGRY